MNQVEFNRFCKGLPAAIHVVQWGGADVWKVGDKVFTIGGRNDGKDLYITFKATLLTYDILKEQSGCRPAPYLASRGMKWIQRTDVLALSDADLTEYIRMSHDLVAQGLTKKRRAELGLD